MPRKATGDRAMTATERSRRLRQQRAEEHARLRTFVQWIIDNHGDAKLVARAKAALGGFTAVDVCQTRTVRPPPSNSKPRANAPQTLARAVVRPMFKGKGPK